VDSITTTYNVYKTWSGGNALAYLSATASTLALDALHNTKTPEEQVKWYAIFQTISNASLLSWYFYDTSIAKKGGGDNRSPGGVAMMGVYMLGNALDVGLTVAGTIQAATPIVGPQGAVIGGLGIGILKTIANEQVVSAIWAMNHGLFELKVPFSHTIYSKDPLLDFHTMRNGDYFFYASGKLTSIMANKKELTFI